MDYKKFNALGSRIAAVVVAACLMWSWASAVRASIIVVTPTGVSASSSLPVYPSINTINNSGLSSPTPATINSTADLPTHNAVPTNMWLTDDGNGPTATITFDLGSVMTINTLYVWNSGEQADGDVNRGAKNVNIDAGIASPDTFVQSFVFSEAPASGPIPAVAYTLSQSITARFIEFDITSNYGNNDSPNYPGSDDPTGANGYVGLSEVRFALVPEPASVLLLGLGALAVVPRRRHRTVSFVIR